MHLSENLTAGKLTATVKPATVMKREGETMVDRPDPLTSWLTLEAGPHVVHLRLTWEQLNALHATLDALLQDHTRYVLGDGEPAEVSVDKLPLPPFQVFDDPSDPQLDLPDRDPTAPVIDPPSHRAPNVRIINGNEVAFTATDDWKLCVHTVNGEPMSNRDLPDWDSYGEAIAYLETILEDHPATVKQDCYPPITGVDINDR